LLTELTIDKTKIIVILKIINLRRRSRGTVVM